jgi:photosystem II stability/assembly factor-like uncharacterized protein
MLTACGNFGSTGHGIYRTTDGGSAWTKITSGLPSSWTGKVQLALDPSNPDVAWASIANTFDGLGLWKSTDAGATWTQTTSLDYAQYQGWYSHWVLVSPFDSQTIFVGGIEIWRSTNGGSTFSERTEWQQAFFGTPPPEGPNGGPQYAHADHHFGIAHPTDPDRYFFASDGGVFRTTDGGNTFRGLVGGYMTTQFYNGFASSATNPNLAIGGMQDNFTAIYEGTIAWNRVIGGDGSWAAINQADDQTIYGSWQSLNIRRSYDGGNNWTTITPPTSGGDETAFIAPYVLAPLSSGPRGGGVDQPVIYAARSRIYRSDNEGSNWTATNGSNELDGNPVLSLAVSASSPDTALAGTAPIHSRARIFRTTNGGSDWSDVTGPLPDRYPSDLAVDPTDSRVVYAAFMGYGTSHLFRSSDAGSSWNDIGAGLPDVPTSAVTVDPDHPEIIYVGTDLGVWVSPNTGVSWHEFVSGLPPAMVNDLRVFQTGRKLRAATHGNAVWERDLLEPTATGVSETVAAASPAALRVHPNPLRPGSRVSFELRETTHVRLEVFDVSGRRVTTLLDASRGRGTHRVDLDPSRLPAGVYFVRLDTGAGRANARVIWTR